MPEPLPLVDVAKLERVVQLFAPESTLLRTWPLNGGISAEMTAFEIRNASGQLSRLILRRPGEKTLQRNPHAAEDEFKVLQLTKSLGLATQTPHYLDQSGAIFSTPYFVMDYIEGQPEFSFAPEADFASQLARHLAQVHSADITKQDVTFLPRATHECVEASRKPQESTQPALGVQPIHNVLEQAISLHEPNEPGLLHGDFWPGNILWRDGALVAVIDWEDTQIGEPLIDFAISRLDILWIFGIDALDSFTYQYQSLMDIDYTNLPYWDLCAALRLARLAGADLEAWTAFFQPFGRDDITEHTLREHFKYFTMQAVAKLRLR